MKIAVATENGMVSGHFGKCEQFTVFETEGSEVTGKILLDTSGHSHGDLPPFLASNGVKAVIAGGMGEGARQKLEALGIGIVAGASGNVEAVVRRHLEGTLRVNGSGCSGEHHHGNHHCNCHGH